MLGEKNGGLQKPSIQTRASILWRRPFVPLGKLKPTSLSRPLAALLHLRVQRCGSSRAQSGEKEGG